MGADVRGCAGVEIFTRFNLYFNLSCAYKIYVLSASVKLTFNCIPLLIYTCFSHKETTGIFIHLRSTFCGDELTSIKFLVSWCELEKLIIWKFRD